MAREKEVKISEGVAREIVREYDANNDVFREVIREFNQPSVGKLSFSSPKFKIKILVEF